MSRYSTVVSREVVEALELPIPHNAVSFDIAWGFDPMGLVPSYFFDVNATIEEDTIEDGLKAKQLEDYQIIGMDTDSMAVMTPHPITKQCKFTRLEIADAMRKVVEAGAYIPDKHIDAIELDIEF